MSVVERKTQHLSHTTTSLVRRLSEQSWHSDAIRNAVAQRRDHIVARLDRLLDATQAMLACASEDHRTASALNADAQRERISDITLRLETRRAKLLFQLQTLYPIEMPSANVPLQSRCYVIRGVQVPVVDSIALLDDDTMSAALGYVCHVVLMISKFMDIPLRYKIHYRCSRSFVTDEVSPIPGHNEYPLYMKGVERAKFECGVILLNRVVDQILRNRNLDTACCQTRGENPARLLENLSRLFASELP